MQAERRQVAPLLLLIPGHPSARIAPVAHPASYALATLLLIAIIILQRLQKARVPFFSLFHSRFQTATGAEICFCGV
jgi:hypothetical protein